VRGCACVYIHAARGGWFLTASGLTPKPTVALIGDLTFGRLSPGAVHPPRLPFLPSARRRPAPDQLVTRVDRQTGIRISLDAKCADQPGASEIDFDMDFASEGGEGATPYEVLLQAALDDSSHFTRQDGVEECWRIVQPILDDPPKAIVYQQGSWGPEEAARITGGHTGWQSPWLPS
jgi:glucose-6-phosphate 1-dehydrogenase